MESNERYKAVSVSSKQYAEHEKMQINHVGKYFTTWLVLLSFVLAEYFSSLSFGHFSVGILFIRGIN